MADLVWGYRAEAAWHIDRFQTSSRLLLRSHYKLDFKLGIPILQRVKSFDILFSLSIISEPYNLAETISLSCRILWLKLKALALLSAVGRLVVASKWRTRRRTWRKGRRTVNCMAFWALLFSFLDLAVIIGVTKRDSWQSSFYAASSHCNDVGVKEQGFL